MSATTASPDGSSVIAAGSATAPSPPISAGNTSMLHLDAGVCARSIGQREFAMRHSVAQHPLFTLEAIAQLADSLPEGAIECHVAKLPLVLPGGGANEIVKPSDIVRNIDRNDRWLVLWNIEQLPPYRALIDSLLDEVAPLLPACERGMGRREAFLFISAPGAITPVHFDPENNFLLQLRGTKHLYVGCFPDRAAELRELDRYHDGGHRNLEQLPLESSHFEMKSGDGVYINSFAPHWVYNGPQASISLSITFRTGKSERKEFVHRCNARLREHGYHARPEGESALVDWVKASCVSAKGWLRRRGRPERGARDFS